MEALKPYLEDIKIRCVDAYDPEEFEAIDKFLKNLGGGTVYKLKDKATVITPDRWTSQSGPVEIPA